MLHYYRDMSLIFSSLDIYIFPTNSWPTFANRYSRWQIVLPILWCVSENIIVFRHFLSLSIHMGIFQWRKHLHIANNSRLFCISLFTTSYIFIYIYYMMHCYSALFPSRCKLDKFTNFPCMYVYITITSMFRWLCVSVVSRKKKQVFYL